MGRSCSFEIHSPFPWCVWIWGCKLNFFGVHSAFSLLQSAWLATLVFNWVVSSCLGNRSKPVDSLEVHLFHSLIFLWEKNNAAEAAEKVWKAFQEALQLMISCFSQMAYYKNNSRYFLLCRKKKKICFLAFLAPTISFNGRFSQVTHMLYKRLVLLISSNKISRSTCLFQGRSSLLQARRKGFC